MMSLFDPYVLLNETIQTFPFVTKLHSHQHFFLATIQFICDQQQAASHHIFKSYHMICWELTYNDVSRAPV